MLDYTRTRGEDVRALTQAIVLGSGAGLFIGVVYLAGSGGHVVSVEGRVGSGSAPVAALISTPAHSATHARLAETSRATATPAIGLAPDLQALRDRIRLAAIALHKPAEPFRSEQVTASGSDLHCLAEAVYFEARGEGQPGQQAVAQVVLNRVRHPAFPKTICGVVHQRTASGCQFSFACGSQAAQTGSTAWRRAETVAAAEMHGAVMGAVGDATHFQTARAGAFAGLLKVAQIGAHVFYRFGGHAGAPSMFQQTPAPSPHSASRQLAQLETTAPATEPMTDPVKSAALTAPPIASPTALKPPATAPKLVSVPIGDPKALIEAKGSGVAAAGAPASAPVTAKEPAPAKAVIAAATLAQS